MVDCPECGERAEKQHVEMFRDGIEIVYTCGNDDGLILPECKVAQFTAHYRLSHRDVDMSMYEAYGIDEPEGVGV